jgi:hypothetical protein
MIIQNPDGSLGYIYKFNAENKPPETEIIIQIDENVNIDALTLEKEKKIVIYFCYQEMFLNIILPVYLNQIYIIFPVILCTLTGLNSIKYNSKGGYIVYIIYLMIDYAYKLALLNLLIVYDKVTLSYSVYLSLFVVILLFNTFAIRLFIKYYKLMN